MHYYDFNIGDFAKKTQHLTNEEELAYRRALDMYYDTEKPLVSDGLATLSRRLRVDSKALENVLNEFFPNGRNKHADEKIAAYYAYIEKQKANGKQGGRPKHKPTANPPPTQNNPVPSQPLPTNPLPTNQVKSKTLSDKSDAFLQFWEIWPSGNRKASQSKCWDKWKKDKLDDVSAIIFAHVNDCKTNGIWKDPQFIEAPLVYLNKAKWDGADIAGRISSGNPMDSFMRKVGAIL